MLDAEELQQWREAAEQAARLLDNPEAHHHMHDLTSVRRERFAGHDIEIRTTYEIRIDGKETALPLSVDPEGRVTCHAIPNYSFPSAVDLIKQIILTYPDDFPKEDSKADLYENTNGNHVDHEHDHAQHDHSQHDHSQHDHSQHDHAHPDHADHDDRPSAHLQTDHEAPHEMHSDGQSVDHPATHHDDQQEEGHHHGGHSA